VSATNPFFNSVERLLKLESVAESWKGTPFMPNAAVKGAGVSCQKLVGAILIEAGALPKDFQVPEGPMNWSHAQTESLIAKFMDEQTLFAPLPAAGGQSLPAACRPGDMLGFKLGGCIHHCGVLIGADGKFVHCLRPQGVQFSNIRDASYAVRIARAWRPLTQ
jgi:cell wall-associated NlpC family hydrolase